MEATQETEDAEGGCLRTLQDLVPDESAGNLLLARKSNPGQNPRRNTVEAPNVAAGWVQSPRTGALSYWQGPPDTPGTASTLPCIRVAERLLEWGRGQLEATSSLLDPNLKQKGCSQRRGLWFGRESGLASWAWRLHRACRSDSSGLGLLSCCRHRGILNNVLFELVFWLPAHRIPADPEGLGLSEGRYR